MVNSYSRPVCKHPKLFIITNGLASLILFFIAKLKIYEPLSWIMFFLYLTIFSICLLFLLLKPKTTITVTDDELRIQGVFEKKVKWIDVEQARIQRDPDAENHRQLELLISNPSHIIIIDSRFLHDDDAGKFLKDINEKLRSHGVELEILSFRKAP